MGQDIKYIAIRQDYELPAAIVHFKEGNGIIIPIDLYDNDFIKIIKNAMHFKTPNDLFDFIENNLCLEDASEEAIKALKDLNVSTLVLSGYREILDIPQGEEWIIFRDNVFIEGDNFTDPHSQIGLNVSHNEIIRNEKRYYSYDDAYYDHHKDDPNTPDYIRKYE